MVGYNRRKGGLMRYAVSVVLFSTLLATVAFAQNRGPYWSLGGYGNVLYPGTGHAPATPPGGIAGSNFSGRSAGRSVYANPYPANHPQHSRTTIVPYPVFYGGGYGYGNGYDPSAGYAPGYGDQAPP